MRFKVMPMAVSWALIELGWVVDPRVQVLHQIAEYRRAKREEA